MSYYDFNEHFWSPSEVCAPVKPEIKENFLLKFSRTFKKIFIGFMNSYKSIR